MADVERGKSYPSVPVRNWWDLRAKFKQSYPTRVDPDYLQAVLGIGVGHARNLIPQLKAVGLIGEDGRPQDIAEDWRHDETYPEACARMLAQIYPQGLRDALPPPNPDRKSVEAWFMRNARVGEGAAGKMASFYLLLGGADPSGGATETRPREGTPRRFKSGKGNPSGGQSSTPGRPGAGSDTGRRSAPPPLDSQGPSLHVDVQVHISPEATAEQIDLIFAAMSKHLYKR